jgi:Rrf2 family protein
VLSVSQSQPETDREIGTLLRSDAIGRLLSRPAKRCGLPMTIMGTPRRIVTSRRSSQPNSPNAACSTHQATAYGIASLLMLGDSTSEPQSGPAISKATGMPEGYVLQIMRRFVIAGLVRSKRGWSGGYVLARPLKDISALDVIRAIDERSMAELGLDRPDPSLNSTAGRLVGHVLANIASSAERRLGRLKLSQL